MKKSVLFSAVCLCIFLLAGCDLTQKPTEETQQAIDGQIYDTGQFQVLVPEPWRVFPITDPFEEGQPVMTNCLFLRKGGESDWHVFEKPYIRIDYYGPDAQMEKPVPNGDLEANVEQLQPMQLEDILLNGYTADSYHGKACLGRFASLWAEDDEQSYQAFVWFESGGDSISLEDRDVRAILSSVAPSHSS